MIEDPLLTKAITNVMTRSEKQNDFEKLVKSFVDPGIHVQLDNHNNQILFGRRGTGKTHVFLYLQQEWDKIPSNLIKYIDVRTLSSSESTIGKEHTGQHYAVSLCRDILNEIHATLIEYITNPENNIDNSVLKELDNFACSITEFTKIPVKGVTETSKDHATRISGQGKAAVAMDSFGVKVGGEAQRKDSETNNSKLEYKFTESMAFHPVYKTLKEVLDACKIKNFYLLIDEWVIIPRAVQPMVAECIKRILLPNANITVKIASIQYRSLFYDEVDGQKIGLELGSDISAFLDLDYYYVYDKNPQKIVEIFSKILYKHLQNELPEDYLFNTFAINSHEVLLSKLFTEKNSFVELVRASEGVIRDFINIFSIAYFNSKLKDRDKIYLQSIKDGAQRWFEQDKYSNLTGTLQQALELIVHEVIGSKRARSFLVENSASKDDILQELIDFRLVHLIAQGISDKSNPGKRYNVFTLDYGTYVDLLKTKSAPDVDMVSIDDVPEEDRVVPFDDKRSIRRIVLDVKVFYKILR